MPLQVQQANSCADPSVTVRRSCLLLALHSQRWPPSSGCPLSSEPCRCAGVETAGAPSQPPGWMLSVHSSDCTCVGGAAGPAGPEVPLQAGHSMLCKCRWLQAGHSTLCELRRLQAAHRMLFKCSWVQAGHRIVRECRRLQAAYRIPCERRQGTGCCGSAYKEARQETLAELQYGRTAAWWPFCLSPHMHIQQHSRLGHPAACVILHGCLHIQHWV